MLRERRFRKIVKVPFDPKKPDPMQMKDEEEKRIAKEKSMYQKFSETHGGNIFLMDFFKALNVIADISGWVTNGNFVSKVARHRNQMRRGLPQMYLSRLMPGASAAPQG